MQIIYNDSHDQYFNLAAEEYLLENSDDDIFMLWRERPHGRCRKKSEHMGGSEHVLRPRKFDWGRPSETGGGAVFHDLGNVNFTFICAYGRRAE